MPKIPTIPHAIHNIDDCGMNCRVCYGISEKMKWIIVIGTFVLTGVGGMALTILDSAKEAREANKQIALYKQEMTYLNENVNDIKKAMGLEIRMPPKLAALKE